MRPSDALLIDGLEPVATLRIECCSWPPSRILPPCSAVSRRSASLRLYERLRRPGHGLRAAAVSHNGGQLARLTVPWRHQLESRTPVGLRLSARRQRRRRGTFVSASVVAFLCRRADAASEPRLRKHVLLFRKRGGKSAQGSFFRTHRRSTLPDARLTVDGILRRTCCATTRCSPTRQGLCVGLTPRGGAAAHRVGPERPPSGVSLPDPAGDPAVRGSLRPDPANEGATRAAIHVQNTAVSRVDFRR